MVFKILNAMANFCLAIFPVFGFLGLLGGLMFFCFCCWLFFFTNGRKVIDFVIAVVDKW